MEMLLINYLSRTFVSIWAFCTAFLIASDWFIYVEPVGKLIVLILGLIAGSVMTAIAFTKKRQADAELKIAELKYEEEKIKHRKELIEEEIRNFDFD
jgi:hypothetical protein